MNREKAKKRALYCAIILFVVFTIGFILLTLIVEVPVNRHIEAILILTVISAGLAAAIGAITFLVVVYDVNAGL